MVLEKPAYVELVKKHACSTFPFDLGFLPHSYKLAIRQYPELGESNQKSYTLFHLLGFNTILSLFRGIPTGLPSGSPNVLHFLPISSSLILSF